MEGLILTEGLREGSKLGNLDTDGLPLGIELGMPLTSNPAVSKLSTILGIELGAALGSGSGTHVKLPASNNT